MMALHIKKKKDSAYIWVSKSLVGSAGAFENIKSHLSPYLRKQEIKIRRLCVMFIW